MNISRWLAIAVAALLATACSRDATPTGDASMASTEESDQLDQSDLDGDDDGEPARIASVKSVERRQGGGTGLPRGALRLQMVEIIDANGFERPIPAYFALIPTGWQARGGVQWGQQFACTNGFNYNWTAQSPDGLQSVAILPQQKWEANNYGAGASSPGCPIASITTVQQYLQQVIAGRPGARMTNFRPRPDLAAKFQSLNRITPMPMGEARTWVEAGEAQFAYQEQGRDMQGMVAAAATFSLMRTSGLANGQTMDALTGYVFPGFVATAPAGKLNPSFAEAIRQSFMPNPDWEARISQHNSAIFRSAQVETRKRSQIISEYNDYVSRLRQETADMRARSDERRQREFSETIRGTETYNDDNAAGGRVELSNMYDNAWRLNDGTYVLSDDANFEPYRDLGVDGRRLERTQ